MFLPKTVYPTLIPEPPLKGHNTRDQSQRHITGGAAWPCDGWEHCQLQQKTHKL